MKFIKNFENFKPIKINNQKPFKVKKNILKHLNTFQKGLKIAKKKLQKEKNPVNRTKIHNDINSNIKRIRDLSLHNLKQAEYLKNNPIKEGKVRHVGPYDRICNFYVLPTDERFLNACKKIEVPEYRYKTFLEHIKNNNLKYIVLGYFMSGDNNKYNKHFAWDDGREIFFENDYTFKGYIDMTPEEIEQIETEETAKKYNI